MYVTFTRTLKRFQIDAKIVQIITNKRALIKNNRFHYLMYKRDNDFNFLQFRSPRIIIITLYIF